jgi:hypothetical protein
MLSYVGLFWNLYHNNKSQEELIDLLTSDHLGYKYINQDGGDGVRKDMTFMD